MEEAGNGSSPSTRHIFLFHAGPRRENNRYEPPLLPWLICFEAANTTYTVPDLATSDVPRETTSLELPMPPSTFSCPTSSEMTLGQTCLAD